MDLHLEKLSHDFGSLLKGIPANPAYPTDVKLVAGGNAFHAAFLPAHKLILSARSPYFEAIFSHGWKDSNEETKVKMPELTADAIRQFRNYIYTGQVENLFKYALQFLPSADMVSQIISYVQATNLYFLLLPLTLIRQPVST